ncbi:MAG: hypothetical protein Q8R53_01940 [Nanoarchaeota archaeon]|nr:hypothetical protein [Nanoarchaeota archaeon]
MVEEKEYFLEVLAQKELKNSLKQIVTEPAAKSEPAGTLEEAVDEHSVSSAPDAPQASERESPLSISYGVQEEHPIGTLVDYGALHYGEKLTAVPTAYHLPDEENGEIHEDAPPAEEGITVEESEEVVQEAQYAVMTGSRYDVNPDGLRKLDWRIALEPSLLVLLTMNAVTRDVDYAPWV